MVISNSSSSSMTSSTMSRESAPTSSVKEVWRVTCSLLTPRFSHTISITRSSTEGTLRSSLGGFLGRPEKRRRHKLPVPASGYVPPHTHPGQGNLSFGAAGRQGNECAGGKKEKNTRPAQKRKGETIPPFALTLKARRGYILFLIIPP